jgi:uncharacterized membrane protein YccF (DUF307 family)
MLGSILYTLVIGFPLCCFLMAVGCALCLTVVGIPFGLACFALGFNVVTLKR